MILLLLVIMLTQSTATANSCSTTNPNWYQKKNFKLRGKVFQTFSYICRSICREACLSFDDCYSVNYFPGNRTSELNEGTHFEFPENLTTSEGSEYAYSLPKGFSIKLTKEPVCFSARDNKYGSFNITVRGQISSFRLVHVSGAVGAYPSGAGNWGSAGNHFETIITDSGNKIISPPVSMLDEYYAYHLPNRNAMNDTELVLPEIEPTYKVMTHQTMRVWHGEDLKDITEHNNHGTSCVLVYANYKNF